MVNTPSSSSLRASGILLGFALGGFYDGILLHQVLQWHHLLSNVDTVRDMRMQILFDGLFHALMYVVAAVALAKLWKARAAANAPGAGRQLCGYALLGFGLWHIVDSVVSHWITGIHRIKVDSPHPLAWDLFWFIAFGVVPMLIAWRLLRPGASGSGRGGSSGNDGRRAAAALGVAALVAGPIAAVPPASDPSQIVVLFAPGVPGHQAFNALASVDARVLWADRSGGMWAVRMDDPKAARKLYQHGALLVSNTGFSLGCLTWTKAAVRG